MAPPEGESQKEKQTVHTQMCLSVCIYLVFYCKIKGTFLLQETVAFPVFFYEKSSGTRSCLKVHIWPASSGEARQRCINSKRHVVRQCVAHAKVVVAWREKKGQICQQAVTSVGGSPCSRCDRDAI